MSPLLVLLSFLLTSGPAMAEAPAPPAGPASNRPASPLEGTWRNTRDTIHIRADRCGPALCGTVISAAVRHQTDVRQGTGRGLVGMRLFTGFRPAGASTWKGQIYIPDLDQSATGKIVLTDPNSITVSGCLLFGLACKTQHWKRIG
ncbi:MAG: DUF2147 domain-containing protein [Sphingomonas sp.]